MGGLIGSPETPDEAAIKLIFFPSVCVRFPVCNIPRSCNDPTWRLLGSVLPKLMSFPKVRRLHVSRIPSFLRGAFGAARSFNDRSGSAELDINWAGLLLLVCDF